MRDTIIIASKLIEQGNKIAETVGLDGIIEFYNITETKEINRQTKIELHYKVKKLINPEEIKYSCRTAYFKVLEYNGFYVVCEEIDLSICKPHHMKSIDIENRIEKRISEIVGSVYKQIY